MQLKEALLQDKNIEKVLEYYGYANISDRGDEIRCGLTEYSNPSSICVLKNNSLTATDFARGINGDIFTLIIEQRQKTFVQVVNEIKNLLNIEIEYTKPGESESICHVFSDVIFKKKEKLEVYPEQILDEYPSLWNEKFRRDGISIETQKKFKLGYDYETNRITIPHRSPDGELCGIIGRINYKPRNKEVNKYFPLLAHKKGLTLFGYAQNYENLYKSSTVYVGESEKFVMQLDSMGYKNAVALCGSTLSKEQCYLIAKLEPEKVVFCFDEGLAQEVIYRNTNKFQMIVEKFNIEIGIVIDRKNKYLKRGSKNSPTDMGKDVWEKLINECYERVC